MTNYLPTYKGQNVKWNLQLVDFILQSVLCDEKLKFCFAPFAFFLSFVRGNSFRSKGVNNKWTTTY